MTTTTEIIDEDETVFDERLRTLASVCDVGIQIAQKMRVLLSSCSGLVLGLLQGDAYASGAIVWRGWTGADATRAPHCRAGGTNPLPDR